MDNLSADDDLLMAQYIQEAYVAHVVKVQSNARRLIARCRIWEYISAKYEKIYDPRHKVHYYYNIETDKSSWVKPRLLLKGDILIISPTYTLDEAVIMIQRQLRRVNALSKVRILYQAVIVAEPSNKSSGSTRYFNTMTTEIMSKLPLFMKNRLDYSQKNGILKTIEKQVSALKADDDDDDDMDDDSSVGQASEESNDSLDSAQMKELRRLARNYPR
jgi:hypothetical protein